MNNWISVEDKMPDQEGSYLCYFTDGTIETFPYENEIPWEWGTTFDKISHWMMLPAPPKTDK